MALPEFTLRQLVEAGVILATKHNVGTHAWASSFMARVMAFILWI